MPRFHPGQALKPKAVPENLRDLNVLNVLSEICENRPIRTEHLFRLVGKGLCEG
jgi:hypothetical protein